MKKSKRGGQRAGAGRKQKYGEPTKMISFRIPISRIKEIKDKVKQILLNQFI